jgi:hypothetical protein
MIQCRVKKRNSYEQAPKDAGEKRQKRSLDFDSRDILKQESCDNRMFNENRENATQKKNSTENNESRRRDMKSDTSCKMQTMVREISDRGGGAQTVLYSQLNKFVQFGPNCSERNTLFYRGRSSDGLDLVQILGI